MILQPDRSESDVKTISVPSSKVDKAWEGWWFGGVECSSSGHMYFLPGGGKNVLKWDPAFETRELIGPDLCGFSEPRWANNAVVGDDGIIYGLRESQRGCGLVSHS